MVVGGCCFWCCGWCARRLGAFGAVRLPGWCYKTVHAHAWEEEQRSSSSLPHLLPAALPLPPMGNTAVAGGSPYTHWLVELRYCSGPAANSCSSSCSSSSRAFSSGRQRDCNTSLQQHLVYMVDSGGGWGAWWCAGGGGGGSCSPMREQGGGEGAPAAEWCKPLSCWCAPVSCRPPLPTPLSFSPLNRCAGKAPFALVLTSLLGVCPPQAAAVPNNCYLQLHVWCQGKESGRQGGRGHGCNV